MSERNLNIYIDGASRGNPGKAGIGIVVKENGKKIKSISQYVGKATNNVIEYKALIYALKETKSFSSEEVKIFSDSKLLVNQLTGKYKVKSEKLKSLYKRVAELAQEFKKIDIEKIAREDNKEADKLANKAIDKSDAVFPRNSS